MSRRADLVDTDLSEQQDLAGVIGRELQCFFFYSVTTCCLGRKCVHARQVLRWKRPHAQAANVSVPSEVAFQIRLIGPRHTALTDSKPVFFRAT